MEAPVLRSDNGLIFQSRQFRQACRDCRLQQEFITPYRPEQNGMVERFFRSLKEECVWQHTFQMFEEARRILRDWMQWYNHDRPHQELGIGVRLTPGHNNPLRWLDFKGARHTHDTLLFSLQVIERQSGKLLYQEDVGKFGVVRFSDR